jgi:hypothetical protein
MTYTALAVLKTLGDDLSRIRKADIIIGMFFFLFFSCVAFVGSYFNIISCTAPTDATRSDCMCLYLSVVYLSVCLCLSLSISMCV